VTGTEGGLLDLFTCGGKCNLIAIRINDFVAGPR
jgi:hypothetical protein